VVTLFPFALVADIFALTALDFLGSACRRPPELGQLFAQGRSNIASWWLTVFPFLALFFTLLLTSFVGEALREAWDPKEYYHREGDGDERPPRAEPGLQPRPVRAGRGRCPGRHRRARGYSRIHTVWTLTNSRRRGRRARGRSRSA